MSHFAVLVIGDNIEEQLQPYHEFECTGDNDQYVQEIDETEEKREEFKTATRSMVRCPDGRLVCRYDDRFYREPTAEEKNRTGFGGSGFGGGIGWYSKDWGDGLGYRAKIHHVPEGYEEINVPFDSFREYLREYLEIPEVDDCSPLDLEDKHKYCYSLIVNGEVKKVIKRTNPNDKWDWWTIGGRWSDFLVLKGKGENRLPTIAQRANQARKGEIWFERMRNDAGSKAAVEWDKANAASGGKTWNTWEHVRDVLHAGNIDAAREAYHAQPAKDAVSKALGHPWNGVDEYLTPRDQYIQQARDGAISLYAIVKDGQWIAKGEMGWFGMSNDDVRQADWNSKVNEMLDALPDETLITVVDCHI